MAPRIRHIATRFALLLVGAAVLPLLAYGFVSILSLQRGTRESVVNGNQNVAVRAAEEIRRYVVTNAELLKALSADLQNTGAEAAFVQTDISDVAAAQASVAATIQRYGRIDALVNG